VLLSEPVGDDEAECRVEGIQEGGECGDVAISDRLRATLTAMRMSPSVVQQVVHGITCWTLAAWRCTGLMAVGNGLRSVIAVSVSFAIGDHRIAYALFSGKSAYVRATVG
jgi:hypothetical protein